MADILRLKDKTEYELQPCASLNNLGILMTKRQYDKAVAEKFTDKNLAVVRIITDGSESAKYRMLTLRDSEPPKNKVARFNIDPNGAGSGWRE